MMDCAEDLSKKLEGSGLIYAATWRTMGDERVRPQVRRKTKSGWKTSYSNNGANHMVMEGVTVKVGDLFDLGNGVKAKAPSKSGDVANDCNCRCFLEYNLMTPEEFAKATGKRVDKSEESGIINMGGVQMKQGGIFDLGALNPNSESDFFRAEEHAVRFYEEIRHRDTDVLIISQNVGWKKSAIEQIKQHIFINKYDLGGDEFERFYPCYDIAISWQNLIDGKNIYEKDLILLKHEYLELNLMKNKNMKYSEAHRYAEQKHNYKKAVDEWRNNK